MPRSLLASGGLKYVKWPTRVSRFGATLALGSVFCLLVLYLLTLQSQGGEMRVKGWRHPYFDSDKYQNELRAIQEEPAGLCPKLVNSESEPLGPPPDGNPLCRIIRKARVKRVAIVGNGPITAQQREDIRSCDIIIRFNLLNNWQRFEEPIDIWMMRYSIEAKAGYWGVNNIRRNETIAIVDAVKAIWWLGGHQHHADALVSKIPGMLQHGPLLIPEFPLNAVFAQELNAGNHIPSTGFVAIRAADYCALPTAKLHIFGFNWSHKTWSGHKIDAEKEYIGQMEKDGRIVIYPTACDGMRECDGADLDNSCHWSSHHRYMASVQYWTDMTEFISADRRKQYEESFGRPMVGVS